MFAYIEGLLATASRQGICRLNPSDAFLPMEMTLRYEIRMLIEQAGVEMNFRRMAIGVVGHRGPTA